MVNLVLCNNGQVVKAITMVISITMHRVRSAIFLRAGYHSNTPVYTFGLITGDEGKKHASLPQFATTLQSGEAHSSKFTVLYSDKKVLSRRGMNDPPVHAPL